MIIYLIQTIVISALLTLSYFALFRTSKAFNLRRFMALSIPVISLVIPFSKYLNLAIPIPESFTFSQTLDEVNVGSTNLIEHSINYNIYEIITIIYAVVTVLLLIRLLLQLMNIFKLRKNSEKQNGVYFIPNNYQAFSFLGSVFIPDSLRENLNLIIKHENIHVQEKHSYDILFYEFLKVVFWFNPFLYILKKELSNVHEFIVDQKLIECNTDIEEYCSLLLQNSSLRYMTIGNNFNHSLTKIRFIMMTKQNNRRWLTIKVAGMLIVIFVSTLVLANQPSRLEMSAVNNGNIAVQDSTYKFADIDVAPEFPGGMDKLMTFLAKNTKYPEIAIKNGVEGKIFVEFVVGKQGKITNVTIKKGVNNNALDSEAVRVVSSMPDWSPGEKDGKKVKVMYIVPINFKLSSPEDPKSLPKE